MKNNNFVQVADILPVELKNILTNLPEEIQNTTYEIRLRINKPVVICGLYGINFVKADGSLSAIEYKYSETINEADFKETVNRICGYSIYSHQNDIANGFVTFGDGHRVGFCGTAVYDENSVVGLKNIDSLNIRIARNVDNSSDEILDLLFCEKKFKGLIVAGAPCTGKTTILKSIAKRISSEYSFGHMKTVMIDERYEFCSMSGINCDILHGFSKEDGIRHAIRVLSPDIIVCDEVISVSEADEIIRSCYSGSKFIVSVHVDNKEDLFKRVVSRRLIDSNFFDYICILKDCESPGAIKEIIKTEELFSEYNCNSHSDNKLLFDSIYGDFIRKQALQGY